MGNFHDLAEHTGTLVVLIGFVITLCLALVGTIYKIMMKIALTLKEDILNMIAKVESRIGDVWDEIAEIRKRQDMLRETLPKEYLRLDGPGYKTLNDGIDRIEGHFEAFTKDCRDGKCWRGAK
jgi:hypothetical protein